MRKIAVFTSGGDSPGMNAAIRAVVRSALYYGLEVDGIRKGYQGMIEGDIIPLNGRSVSNIIFRGGTILHSSRSEQFKTLEGRQQAHDHLLKNEIEGLIAIGGNGTFAGAREFYQDFGVPVIGIPGTIDNDLFGTDFTLGFDTATNTVVQAIDKIRDTAESHDRVFFIEVMGRDSGFIALISGVAGGAESVLIPEVQYDMVNLYKTLNRGWKNKKSSLIVIVAEGDEVGGAAEAARKVKSKFTDLECRVVVLGHIQRGGPPSCNDRVLGTRLGVAAVEALIKEKKDVMAGFIGNEVVFTPLADTIEKKHFVEEELFRTIDMMAH